MNMSRDAVSFKTPLIRPRGELTHLYHQVRENEARLVDDLDIAREVQQQLLPRSTPTIPALDLAAACVPARELGGDFYDFLPYGSGRLAVALRDDQRCALGEYRLSKLRVALRQCLYRRPYSRCDDKPSAGLT